MLILPGSLPSITSALPGRPSWGIDRTPSHVSVFLQIATPALFYSPSSQVWAKGGIFKACLRLEVKGDTPRRVHLSRPLWRRKDPVTTRGESGTGLDKACVTSQARGLGPLAQDVLRLGIPMVGEGCAHQTDLWRGVRPRFSGPAVEGHLPGHAAEKRVGSPWGSPVGL